MPDVRAVGAGLDALWIGGVGCPGWGAGCPAAREEPDVRADVVQLRVPSLMAPDFRAGAGCPGLWEGPDVRAL